MPGGGKSSIYISFEQMTKCEAFLNPGPSGYYHLSEYPRDNQINHRLRNLIHRDRFGIED